MNSRIKYQVSSITTRKEAPASVRWLAGASVQTGEERRTTPKESGVKTYWPLIIPDIAALFGIFMLMQFFRSIPRELEEAAYIDDASRFRTYWSVALPLSRPALLTLAILQFQGAWNDYTKPLLFLQMPNLMTLTIGIAFFRFQYTNDLSTILVGAMFNAIPMLVLFFIFSKYYMEGASYSGLAGQ
jgi:ABC-type glycerol-3-phosphate transport system permease component